MHYRHTQGGTSETVYKEREKEEMLQLSHLMLHRASSEKTKAKGPIDSAVCAQRDGEIYIQRLEKEMLSSR
jgi:hypothetical protein